MAAPHHHGAGGHGGTRDGAGVTGAAGDGIPPCTPSCESSCGAKNSKEFKDMQLGSVLNHRGEEQERLRRPAAPKSLPSQGVVCVLGAVVVQQSKQPHAACLWRAGNHQAKMSLCNTQVTPLEVDNDNPGRGFLPCPASLRPSQVHPPGHHDSLNPHQAQTLPTGPAAAVHRLHQGEEDGGA